MCSLLYGVWSPMSFNFKWHNLRHILQYLVVLTIQCLFQQGLRFDKNQSEEDMDKTRQKYCKLPTTQSHQKLSY